MLRVAYIGGSWSSNIGNAFYNLGSDALFGGIENVQSFFVPDPPQWKDKAENDFDLIGNLDVDVVILTGPCLNLKLPQIFRRIFENLKSRNVKIGFVSAGMSLYDEGEAAIVKKFFDEFTPTFLFTRDSDTYNFFKDLPHTLVYDGLCASMFLNDAVKVPDIAMKEYFVTNFDGNKEPQIDKGSNGTFTIGALQKKLQRELAGIPIVRTNNNEIGAGYKEIYSKPNMYHSDLPFGYLSILKNAKVVFSERVHTCAATLILGGTAQFVPVAKRSHEKRARLFERVGLSDIYDQPVQLDLLKVEEEKLQMKNKLAEVLKSTAL